MTRIDPNQLLTTMSVLLAPDGGIKSIEEVPRIVQLMHKFSKKLVSKCIYIHILRSSSPELLEQFLAKNGWELLNQWFFDAYTNGNLYLCGDLVRLFALCPMTGHRLKSDPSTNQAPRILRQLSTDTRIEAEIRNLSTQVVHQWIRIARKKPLDDDYAAPEDGGGQGGDYYNMAEEEPVQEYDADHSEDYVPPVKTKKVDKKDGVAVKKTQGVKKAKAQPKPKNNALEKLKKKDDNKDNDSVDDLLDGTTSEDSDSDSADEMVERQKAMAAKRAALGAKKLADLTSVNKSPTSASSKSKFEEREKEIRRRREAQAAKERRAERAKPYSRTELRGDLEDGEKDRIKKIAAALKEQNKNKSKISSLGRIPKLPKKEVPAAAVKSETVNGEVGFSAMLGSLDTAKPKPKPSLVKNKNRDLLETLTAKPRSKAELEKEQKEKEKQIQERMKEDAKIEEKIKKEEEERKKIEAEKQQKLEEDKKVEEEKQAAKEKEAEKKDEKKTEKRERKNSSSSNSSNSSDDERREKRRKEKEEERRKRKEKEEKRRKEKEREKDKERRDSNSSDKDKERSKDKKDKTKDKSKDDKEIKSKEERKGEKRSSTEEKQSVKKVKVIKESNMFGDILSSIMKDDKSKKKRRPSDKEKEMSKSKESEKDSSDNKKDEEKSENSESAVEERLSPIREEQSESGDSSVRQREKKGILVYARGFKAKRSLRWANEMSLVQIEYFELDETERTNVFKQKLNFAERRKQELVMEKNKMKHGGGDEGLHSGHYEHEEKRWSLSRLDIEHPVEYGCESKERDVQRERETRVLTQLYFGNSMPSDPSEPDPMPKSAGTVEPKAIPQIDLTNTNSETDFSANGWTSKLPPPPTAFDALIAAPVKKSSSLERTSPTDHSAPPQAAASTAASKPPTNLQELLSSLKPGLLENIVNMANTMSSSSSNNTSASGHNNQNNAKSAVSPTYDNNYHNNKPFNKSETAGNNRPKFTLPPPVNHNAPYPKGPQRGFEARGGHQSRDRDNWDNHRNDRNNHYNNHHHDNYHSGAGGRKVCNFFAKTGKCRFGDNCTFAHIPSDNHHNHNTRVY